MPFPTRTEPCSHCGAPRATATGDALRAYRKRLGLSLIEVAAKLGVAFGHVGDIERGRRFATPAILNAYTRLKEPRPDARRTA